MKRYLYLIIFFFLLTGCISMPDSVDQESRPAPTIASPTESIEKSSPPNIEAIDLYTQELHDRIRSCIEFRNIYDFTEEGGLIDYKIGVQKIRECIDGVLEVHILDECMGCGELGLLVEEFSNRTLESMRMIEEGHELQKEVYISEGLVTFWDGDLLWDAIRLTIARIRAEHNLPELN
jgi:hypothetical protein